MKKAFSPSRQDGRSDRRVIFELAGNAAPETLFTYEELADALQDGLEGDVDRARVSSAVRQGNKTLLKEKRRFLAPVAGVGYRMARADEHVPLALIKKSRAETQIRGGIELLKNVRVDELSEDGRKILIGQTLIWDGMYRAIRASEQRHERQEQLIAELRRQQEDIGRRLESIEVTTGP